MDATNVPPVTKADADNARWNTRRLVQAVRRLVWGRGTSSYSVPHGQARGGSAENPMHWPGSMPGHWNGR